MKKYNNAPKKSEAAVLPERELLCRIEQWFRECSAPFPLEITGHSMAPFAAPGRDIAYLYPFNGKVKKGEVILARMSTGRLLLHRVVKTGKRTLTAGDAFSHRDSGYAVKIYAVCRSVKRKNKIYTENSLFWRFFAGIWVNIVPFRGILLRLRIKKQNTTERNK